MSRPVFFSIPAAEDGGQCDLPTSHRREDIDRITLHDLRLKAIVSKLHITPVDKKVDMTVHLTVFVQ